MADLPAFVLVLATLTGGTTVLASQSGDLPARRTSEIASPAWVAAQQLAARGNKNPTGPIVIARQDDGMFYADGQVGGQNIRFLIDTGSNVVILSPGDAARLGIGMAELGDTIQTVGGLTVGARTNLAKLTIAGRELHDVDAEVAPNALPVSLLGENVLSRLGDVRLKGPTLILR